MSEVAADVLTACRDLRLLTTFWFGTTIVGGIVALHYAALYAFGVRLRLPRMRSTMKRLARERDVALREAATATAEVKRLRGSLETIGLDAQKEIQAADARVRREQAIRKKTEDRLVEQNKALEDERDLTRSLQEFLAAVQGHVATPQPGEPGSWLPSQIEEAARTK